MKHLVTKKATLSVLTGLSLVVSLFSSMSFAKLETKECIMYGQHEVNGKKKWEVVGKGVLSSEFKKDQDFFMRGKLDAPKFLTLNHVMYTSTVVDSENNAAPPIFQKFSAKCGDISFEVSRNAKLSKDVRFRSLSYDNRASQKFECTQDRNSLRKSTILGGFITDGCDFAVFDIKISSISGGKLENIVKFDPTDIFELNDSRQNDLIYLGLDTSTQNSIKANLNNKCNIDTNHGITSGYLILECDSVSSDIVSGSIASFASQDGELKNSDQTGKPVFIGLVSKISKPSGSDEKWTVIVETPQPRLDIATNIVNNRGKSEPNIIQAQQVDNNSVNQLN